MLRLNPDYGYFLGCVIKESSITFSTMDFSGHLTYERKCQPPDEALGVIAALIKDTPPLSCSAIYRKNKPSAKATAFIEKLEGLPIPHPFRANNVETLARVYHFYHESEANFVLVKYGPGVGSSIYVNGAPILRKNGTQSEIGHTLLPNGKTLEAEIAFSSLLYEGIEEKEGAELICKDKAMLEKAEECLASALVNSDALLAFDRIIFAGILLSKHSVIEEIKEKIKANDSDFDLSKIAEYPHYDELNSKIACLLAFLNRYE